MEKYKCIVIEDEPLGAEIIEGYINQIPFLTHYKTCYNAITAMEILQKEKIDLIFLDIHLPKISGFDFLKTLRHPPKVIITTAYHQYALQGYEFNIIDYLLKPIEFNRFLLAVNKLDFSKIETQNEVIQNERLHLFFNVNKKKTKIYLDEIHYIESQKEYIRICTTSKMIVTKMPISEIEELLSQKEFMRVHRSFIVSKRKIESFTSNDIDVGVKQIPIGRSYKELVNTIFSSKH